MREAGFFVRRDAVGNVFGRVEGSRGGRVVMTGSHLDTVRAGGALDGALGIVAAIEALEAVVRERGRPQRIVEVVAISDHEGGRFGRPGLGPRAMAGRLDADELGSRDQDGVRLDDALQSAGLDPATLAGCERLDLDVFLELHVEQGARLEDAGARLGVVTGAAGVALFEITVSGSADDASTPLDRRRDALLGAAEVALAIDAIAARAGSLATVGELAVEPRQSSVVSSRVRLLVDLRESRADVRSSVIAEIRTACARIAHERGLTHDIRTIRDAAPRALDAPLARALRLACERAGASALDLASVGSHPATVLAAVARTGLVLVPSIGGRSHRPDEATAAADVLLGARALGCALEDVLYPG